MLAGGSLRGPAGLHRGSGEPWGEWGEEQRAVALEAELWGVERAGWGQITGGVDRRRPRAGGRAALPLPWVTGAPSLCL